MTTNIENYLNNNNNNYNINITNHYYINKPKESFDKKFNTSYISNFSNLLSFDEKWNTSHISKFEKFSLILSTYPFTLTLEILLKNKNNMNVIIDKESNSGIVYKKDKIEQIELDDLLEKSFVKLYNHLIFFLDELKENDLFYIDPIVFNNIKTKLNREYEIHIKKNKDKKKIFNKMTDIYEKNKNESIKLIQKFNPTHNIEKILD